jgi:hypothetical protein
VHSLCHVLYHVEYDVPPVRGGCYIKKDQFIALRRRRTSRFPPGPRRL